MMSILNRSGSVCFRIIFQSFRSALGADEFPPVHFRNIGRVWREAEYNDQKECEGALLEENLRNPFIVTCK